MFPSPQSGPRGLERLIWLKYYNVKKWQITFTLELFSIFSRLILKLSIIVKEVLIDYNQ